MEDKNPIQVADRLFKAMELLAEKGSLPLIDISRELGLNKSTAHRVVNSLSYMGYVKQDKETGRYELTFKLVGLANQIINKVDIVRIVHPYLEKLMETSGETVHFVERDGIDAVYIDKVEAHQNSMRMVSRIGNRIPMYCSGVGKAMAALMNPGSVQELWEQSEIVRLTPYTITDYDEFLHCLDEIRIRGYALDNEENETGVRCIAIAFPNYRGEVRYALSISAPVGRMDNDRIRELAAQALEIKEEILKELA